MYAHGSCLYVDNESMLLYVVSISLHAQRYIQLCESAPVPWYQVPSTGVPEYR